MLAQGPAEEMEKQLSLSCCAQAAVTSRGHTEEQCCWGDNAPSTEQAQGDKCLSVAYRPILGL